MQPKLRALHGQITRRSVENGGRFDAVETLLVLLVGTRVETYLVEVAGSVVLRAGREVVELRDVATVDGKLQDFTRRDVRAKPIRCRVERHGVGDDVDIGRAGSGDGEREIELAILSDAELNFRRGRIIEAGLLDGDGVDAGTELRDGEGAVFARGRGAFDVRRFGADG